ncbi:hypothetical protein RRG08_002521 [Elysia crispata]|uniref:G-protein coupled receptors family 1 profile domain-containing protein n=1 Tax=Elysia crispata TaxID=231223 RepID=A0AAE1AA20_9GAST|nr:hypothetical protein RRG08_002521 [Elysia crispata]
MTDDPTLKCLTQISTLMHFPSSEAFFKCPTGHYIRPEHRCDGWNDCKFTHADEANCSTPCSSPNFLCSQGQCLDEAAKCDGICDCPHCDDELNCPLFYCEPSTHSLCRSNLRCIRHEHVCDGKGHCKVSNPDVDEYLCSSSNNLVNSTSCPQMGKTLELSPVFCDGRCVLGMYRCDYFPDCSGGEDETGCFYTAIPCEPGFFRCSNHKCIPEALRCDARNDCYDWSDEKHCDNVRCPPDHVRCDSGQCIPRHKWCNHWPNCPDRSDEKNCEYRSCGKDEFGCHNGECVPAAWVCYNGRNRPGYGCEDQSHLIDCEDAQCGEDEFKCTKSICVDKDQICDKSVDCIFTISDEAVCEYSCPEKTKTNFTCTCFDTVMNCENRGYPSLTLPSRQEPINKLKLSGNFLNNSITTSAFFSSYGSPMDGIIDLDLSNNSLTFIPDRLFENMWRLQILNLANNFLTSISSELLNGLSSLIQIHLDGNQIHFIANGSFLGLARLTTLDLSDQNLSRLERNVFYGLHSLHYLNLSGNNLNILPDGVFNGLKKLTKLDISHNSIGNIDKRVFYGLPQLKNLITDEYRFCCLAPWVERCEPQPDEFSSCEDLMSNGILRIAIWAQGMVALFGNLVVVVWRCRDLQGRKPCTSLGPTSLGPLSADHQPDQILAVHLPTSPGPLSADHQPDQILAVHLPTSPGPLSADHQPDQILAVYLPTSPGPLSADHQPDQILAVHLSTSPGPLSADHQPDQILVVHLPTSPGPLSADHQPDQILAVHLPTSPGPLSADHQPDQILAVHLPTSPGPLSADHQPDQILAVHSLLITNLAIGDFLMGVYLIIIAITDSYYRGVYMLHEGAWRSSHLCHFAGFVSTFSSELSVLTLTIITLDRLICIIFPLRFARLSVRNAVGVISAVWLLVFLISIVPLSGMAYFQNFYGRSGVCLALHVTPAQPPGWEYSVSVFLVLNFLSFLIIAFSYIWMFFVAKKTRSAARVPESKTEAAMARRMTFIVVTDFACWVPIILLGFVSLGGVRTSNDIYAWVAVVFLPVNSAINPLLYTLSTAPFMINVQKRVRGFRKSFMTSQHETKQSFLDHRTALSETDRRHPLTSDTDHPIKMKKLRINIRGQSSETGSSV